MQNCKRVENINFEDLEIMDYTRCDQKWGNTFYSHSGEDIIVLNIFDQLGIKNPSYIDVGAHSPTTISNTHLMYSRGSRGINIEANPNLIENFHRERPGDINLNVGIVPSDLADSGNLKFYMFDDYSGRNTLSASAATACEEEGYVTESGEFKVRKVIDIPVRTLKSVIDEYCDGKFPDFLNIDVEGLDYAILEDEDFLTSGPKVICAESLPENANEMINMMRYDKGYLSVFRVGMNNIFIHCDYLYLFGLGPYILSGD